MNGKHVCARCGKTLNPVNWSTVSIGDRYGASKWKLCGDCAAVVEEAIAATLGSVPDEIELTQSYDAGFRNGVMAVFQQLEGIESYEELQDLIAEYWGEGEGYDEP